MIRANPKRVCRAFTLFEVLIALLIFSLGLIGVAGLLVFSMKANFAASQRTQATFLAQSLAERMRANIIGVWHGSYDGSWSSPAASSCNPTTSACNPDGLAAYDLSAWFDQVQQQLPNASASLACARNAVPTPPDLKAQPPYQGVCTLRMNWDETIRQGTVDAGGVSASGAQSFSWIFTP